MRFMRNVTILAHMIYVAYAQCANIGTYDLCGLCAMCQYWHAYICYDYYHTE